MVLIQAENIEDSKERDICLNFSIQFTPYFAENNKEVRIVFIFNASDFFDIIIFN